MLVDIVLHKVHFFGLSIMFLKTLLCKVLSDNILHGTYLCSFLCTIPIVKYFY